MCDVCPLSTSLHFDSSSTVVTSHVVFMLSSNHKVNQKIQLCPSICVFHCLPKLSMSYTGVCCIFCRLDLYRTSAHVSVNASVCPFVNACINVCST